MGLKKLYIDIDGVLLTKRNTKPADDVIPFIDFITSSFYCYWLTTHCKGDCGVTLLELRRYFSDDVIEKLKTIKPTNWDTLKTERIDFTSDFIWIEDYPLESEIQGLLEHDCKDKLIVVDLSRKGELLRIMKLLK